MAEAVESGDVSMSPRTEGDMGSETSITVAADDDAESDSDSEPEPSASARRYVLRGIATLWHQRAGNKLPEIQQSAARATLSLSVREMAAGLARRLVASHTHA